MLKALSALGLELPTCRRLLIVDDEPSNLEVLEALLEADYEVLRAPNGRAALALLEREGPVDLVLSDQRMPFMTGTEFLAQMVVQYPDTVRILLTAYTDVDPILTAVNRGNVYRFLLKPWEPLTLRTAVQDGLALKARGQLLASAVTLLSARRAELEGTLSELERAQNQLIAAERLGTLGRITSGITHDINNQLSALLFLTDTMSAPGYPVALQSAAAEATDVLESILRIVSDVNTFAKRRDIETRRSNVNILEFVRETLVLLALETPGIEVTVDLPPDAYASVDVARTRQALLALLRNAARAVTQRGEVRVVGRDEPGFALEIVDTGIGMHPSTLDRAFDPFFSGFEPPALGLGLGLARLVAQAHGGRIELQSSPGRGTRAALFLPPTADIDQGAVPDDD